MAKIINCKECGRIFQYNGISKICPSCRRKDEEAFKIVKEYVYDNKDATIIEVTEETGVSEEKILRFLREGKLEITGDDDMSPIECERCGRGIRTGRFCEVCMEELANGLQEGLKDVKKVEKKESKNKMYTAERKRR